MISALAAMTISDLGPTVVAFFLSFGLATMLTWTVLSLPDLLGIVQTPGLVANSSIYFTFSAVFPIAFIVDLVGTIVGAALGERLLPF